MYEGGREWRGKSGSSGELANCAAGSAECSTPPSAPQLQPAPFQPPDLPPYDAALGAQELQLLVSPFLLESALWVFWAAGRLQASVGSPLGVDGLALFAPDIKQFFPQDSKVQASCGECTPHVECLGYPDLPPPLHCWQATVNLTVPVDIIMSDSPAGAFAILTADVAFSPLNGSEPPPLAFVVTAQVRLIPLSLGRLAQRSPVALLQATAGVDLFINATQVNGTLRQSLAASLSGVSCALTVAEVSGGVLPLGGRRLYSRSRHHDGYLSHRDCR